MIRILNYIREKLIGKKISRDLLTPQQKIHPHLKNYKIGEYSYGSPTILAWTNKYSVIIGKFCSINSNVTIIVDGNHRVDWISTYPFGNLIGEIPKNPGHPAGKGDILIGNDVWIGLNVIILPGVKIGDGAVVGAGSVVTRIVQDYEIVAGNPIKHIRYRFTTEEIDILKSIKWWDWPKDMIIKYADLLQSNKIKELEKISDKLK
jgi:lipopolysaccharide transport system ATP-binding protein